MASVRRKTITRWILPDGTRVPARTPGATKRREKTLDYYGVWTDETGEHWLRFKNCRDHTAALVLLGEHLKLLNRIKAGLEKPASPRRRNDDHVIKFY